MTADPVAVTGLPRGAGAWTARAVAREAGGLIRLAGPVAGARAGNRVLVITDAVLLGWLSAEQLAVHSVALAVVFILMVGLMALMLGTPVVASRAVGAGRPDEAGAAWRRTVPLGLVAGGCAMVPCWFGTEILAVLGQTPALAAAGGEVIGVLAWSLPSIALFIGAAVFLEAIGRPLPGMLVMLAGCLVNAGLDWVLIFGHVGAPALGAVGAAWATVAVRWLMAVALLAVVWGLPGPIGAAVRRRPIGGWGAWRVQRQLGTAAAGSMVAEVSAFSAVEIMAGWIGTLALAATAVARSLIGIAFMIATGLGAATGIRVGRAIGRGDPAGATLAAVVGTGVAIMIAVGGAAPLWLAPGVVAGLFTTDPALIAVLVPVVPIVGVVLITDATQGVLAHALRGYGIAWSVTRRQLVAWFAATVPTCWLAGVAFGYGPTGIVGGLLFGTLVSAVLLTHRFVGLARPVPARVRPTRPG